MFEPQTVKTTPNESNEMGDGVKTQKPCECQEHYTDILLYGMHACRSGKRIDPNDIRLRPDGYIDWNATLNKGKADHDG